MGGGASGTTRHRPEDSYGKRMRPTPLRCDWCRSPDTWSICGKRAYAPKRM